MLVSTLSREFFFFDWSIRTKESKNISHVFDPGKVNVNE
jgi:hypothetical protein